MISCESEQKKFMSPSLEGIVNLEHNEEYGDFFFLFRIIFLCEKRYFEE